MIMDREEIKANLGDIFDRYLEKNNSETKNDPNQMKEGFIKIMMGEYESPSKDDKSKTKED